MYVNFKGFKNVGYNGYTNYYPVKVKAPDGSSYMMPKLDYKILHVELNNNKENDLDEFKTILKDYPNDYDKNSIDLEYSDIYEDENSKEKEIMLSLNGKDIELSEKTLPVFKKLSNLMKKIVTVSVDDLEQDKNQHVSSNAIHALSPMFTLIKACEGGNDLPFVNALGYLRDAFTPEFVHVGTNVVNKRLANSIDEFENNNTKNTIIKFN